MSTFISRASLRQFNTFGIHSICYKLAKVASGEALQRVFELTDPQNAYILGGGSNVLLPDYLDLTVIKMEIGVLELVEETKTSVLIKAGSGVDWHSFVLYCLDRGWGGLENLSLIPGTVGAAPIQNIGAYGLEVAQFVDSVVYFSYLDHTERLIPAQECDFSYRSSVFKNELANQGVITHVYFRLPKVGQYALNLSYNSLKTEIQERQIQNIDAKTISKIVCDIRRSKLPDPSELGNAGSFFKNPIVNQDQIKQFQETYPDMVYYPVSEEKVKVPAAWLIDRCGCKGRREGSVGSYEKQALVIVNYGGATSQEVRQWAAKIQKDVFDTFGIFLEPEVNILNEKGRKIDLELS